MGAFAKRKNYRFVFNPISAKKKTQPKKPRTRTINLFLDSNYFYSVASTCQFDPSLIFAAKGVRLPSMCGSSCSGFCVTCKYTTWVEGIGRRKRTASASTATIKKFYSPEPKISTFPRREIWVKCQSWENREHFPLKKGLGRWPFTKLLVPHSQHFVFFVTYEWAE